MFFSVHFSIVTLKKRRCVVIDIHLPSHYEEQFNMLRPVIFTRVKSMTKPENRPYSLADLNKSGLIWVSCLYRKCKHCNIGPKEHICFLSVIWIVIHYGLNNALQVAFKNFNILQR